ncbi:centromere protein e [Anaeramoeba ignava]|uniref:Centromere protein e n=1 Tax=Anaeramoeba ignava TaxID=1746090 RepID=A0A9Q0LH74_ANAIG|nr:centromere protein e [Anaeramoeba ignava]
MEIQVAIRLRPLNEKEINSGHKKAWKIEQNSLTEIKNSIPDSKNQLIESKNSKPKIFHFNQIFDEKTSTDQVYEKLGKQMIDSVMKGINATIFAYGQTSSGKTHTLSGSYSNPGLIPLSVNDVFDRIKQIPDREYLLRISYLEIYNENVIDLLSNSKENLRVFEDKNNRFVVENLREEVVVNTDQVLDYLEHGNKNKHIGSTQMNDKSSRSHTIFTMIIESRKLKQSNQAPKILHEKRTNDQNQSDLGSVKVSILRIVDLAGSERASHTGVEGLRMKEGSHINRSLLTLGTVISRLSKGKDGHIPFRDSFLTRILKPSLGGNVMTLLICTICPSIEYMEISLNSLDFASRAMKIKNKPQVNKIMDDKALLRRYRRQILDLKKQLKESQNHDQKQEKQQKLEQIKQFLLSSKTTNIQKQPNRRETWHPGYRTGPNSDFDLFRIDQESEQLLSPKRFQLSNNFSKENTNSLENQRPRMRKKRKDNENVVKNLRFKDPEDLEIMDSQDPSNNNQENTISNSNDENSGKMIIESDQNESDVSKQKINTNSENQKEMDDSNDLRKENERLLTIISEYENREKQMKKDFQDSKDENEKIWALLKQAEGRIQVLQKRNMELESCQDTTINNLEKEMSKMQTDHEQFQKSSQEGNLLREKLSEMEEEKTKTIMDLENQLTQARNELQNTEEEKTNLVMKVSMLTNQLEKVEKQLQEETEKQNPAFINYENHPEYMSLSEEDKGIVHQLQDELNDSILALESSNLQISTLIEQKEDLQARLEEFQHQMEQTNLLDENLKKQVEQQITQIESLNQQLEESQNKYDKSLRDANKITAKLREQEMINEQLKLQSEQENLHSKELKDALENTQKAVELLDEGSTQLTKENDLLQETNKKLEEQLFENQQLKEELEEKLRKAEEKQNNPIKYTKKIIKRKAPANSTNQSKKVSTQQEKESNKNPENQETNQIKKPRTGKAKKQGIKQNTFQQTKRLSILPDRNRSSTANSSTTQINASKMKKELETANQQVKKLTRENRVLSSDVANQKKIQEKNQAKILQLETKMKSVIQEKTAIQIEKSSLERDLKFSQKRIQTVETDLGKLRQKQANFKNQRAEITRLGKEIDSLKKKIESKDSQITKLTNENSKQEQNIAILEKKIADLQLKSKQLEEEKTSLEKKEKLLQKQMKENMASSTKEIENLKANSTKILEEKESQIKDLNQKLQTNINEKQDLSSTVNNLKEIISTKEEMLKIFEEEKLAVSNELKQSQDLVQQTQKNLNLIQIQLNENLQLSENLKEELNQKELLLQQTFSEKENLSEDLILLQQKSNKEASKLLSEIEEFRKKVQETENQVENLEKENRELKSAKIILSEQMQKENELNQSLKSEIAELKNSVKQQQEEIQEIVNEKQNYLSQLTTGKHNENHLSSQITHLTKQISHKEQVISELEELKRIDESKYRETISSLQQNLEELSVSSKTNISHLEQKLEQKQSEISQLSKINEQLKMSKIKLQQEITTQKDQEKQKVEDVFTRKIQDLTNESQALFHDQANKIQEQSSMIENLQSSLEEKKKVNEHLEQLQSQNQQLFNQVKTLMEQAKKDTETLQNEILNKQSALDLLTQETNKEISQLKQDLEQENQDHLNSCKVLEETIAILENKQTQDQDKRKKDQAKIHQLQSEKTQIVNQNEKQQKFLENKISHLQIEMDKYKSLLSSQNKQENNNQNTLLQELSNLRSQVFDLQQKIEDYEQNELRNKSELKKIQKINKNLILENKKYQETQNSLERKEDPQNSYQKTNLSIQQLTQKVIELEKLVHQIRTEKQKYQIAYQKLEDKMKKNEPFEKVQLNSNIALLEFEVQHGNNKVNSLKEEISALRKELAKEKSVNEKQNREKQTYLISIADNKTQITQLEKKVLELSSQLQNVSKTPNLDSIIQNKENFDPFPKNHFPEKISSKSHSRSKKRTVKSKFDFNKKESPECKNQ